MLKWVTTTCSQLQSLRDCRLMPRVATTMAPINFVLTTTLIIAALAQTTNGFRPVELNASAEGRKLFGGYRITPKHCRATKTLPVTDPRTNGPTICMFNHECAQRSGEVVGACMDGFLFGACCQIPHSQDLESTLINDAQNAYYQQHQQQKLQLQQTISNPAAAQSYETYGEQLQQSQESNKYNERPQYGAAQVQHDDNYQEADNLDQLYQQLGTSSTTPHAIYDQANIDKVYQQLDSSGGSNGYGPQHISTAGSQYHSSQVATVTSPTSSSFTEESVELSSASTASSVAFDQAQQSEEQQSQQQDVPSSSQQVDQDASSSATEGAQSASLELEIDSSLQANPSSNAIADSRPANFHVHKNSVKISSPSSPPHSDDFVMQVLSTLPPSHENDQITFTTEVPTKIHSNIADPASSESSSFEEIPSATQLPVMLNDDTPLKNVATQSEESDESKPQVQQPQPHQRPQQHKKPQQSQKHQPMPQQHSGMHNHNHLLLADAEFTHSDITHPGADADLVENDLQFSTGYGPQPVYIEMPNKQSAAPSYSPVPTTLPPPPAEDKYVLVQTISNDQPSKKPPAYNSPTTTSSITTHVDSIESIILQLNGTNHGPTYNIVSQQTPSYDAEGASSATSDASNGYEQQTSYYDSTVSSPTTTQKPSTYYEEVETKRPEDFYSENELQSQQKYPSAQAQVPAYLEPTTTTLNLNAQDTVTYDPVEDDNKSSSSYLQNEYPTPKPITGTSPPTSSYNDEISGVLDEHTMPANNYNDATASEHATSEFNKMPAVGIAYPVDMSYMEEEGNIAIDGEMQPGYGSQVPSEKPLQTSTSSSYQKQPEHTEQQPTYTKVSSTVDSNKRPIASYIGVVTSQNYNQQPQASVYNQVPNEVSVSSQTTKVQGEYESSSAYQTPETDKFTTITYSDSPITTLRPSTARPITNSYISSTSRPVETRPQYDSQLPESSTLYPHLVTASSKRPRPKPSTKRPSKRPGTTNTKKTSKPKPSQPNYSYNEASQPSSGYGQSQGNIKRPAAQPTNTYNKAPIKQPTDSYNSEPIFNKKPAAQPTSTYNQDEYVKKPTTQATVPAPSSTYQQPQNSYDKQPTGSHVQPQATYEKQPLNAYQKPQFPNSYQQPSNNNDKKPSDQPSHQKPQPSNSYQQPSNSYDKKPNDQPSATYQGKPTKLKKPAASSTSTYPPDPIEEQSITNYGQGVKHPAQPALTYNQDHHVASSPTKRPPSHKPSNKKPISTSYVTGPTTPRPPTTFVYHDEKVPPILIADDKLDSFVHSTAEAALAATPASAIYQSTYQSPVFLSSVTPVYVQRPQNNYKKPGFVKVQPTVKPPVPTVLITPKPTVNLVTSSSWTQKPYGGGSSSSDITYPSTTPMPAFGSTSYIYSQLVTRRPDFAVNTPEYVSLPAITSNDFDDPGYYGAQPSVVHPAFTQATTEAVYAVPSDDRPAFPGYYGPTPTYPAFSVPGEKVGSPGEEETYTSPNDFVNFPPVRNPNLNMSASSSAVTTDLELSTPAFVEDVVLKEKMNTLVHKIVESLQGNFDALADMIDDSNNTAATYSANTIQSTAGTTLATRKPTRKPTRVTSATKPKVTTKKPVTRVTTRKPVTRRTTTTRKPAATRKPTRKATTSTTSATVEDEIVDEEDEEDVNPAENEIDEDDAQSAAGAGGRKFKCGVRPHVKSGRIVGGKGASFGAFPWQVLVRESTWLGLFTKNKCGGVLITNRYVITAAHCQPGFLASLVAVMGEFDISGDLESKRAVTKNVKRVIVHRQYDPATFENDLALLELESPVQFDTHIVPICMPNDLADFTGRMATVTGWGRLKYGGGVPSVLQEVQVPIIENSVCQEMFHTAGHNKKILGSFLCAGYANGQKDSCEGDSGGPLVLQRPDGRYELAGTVSHGIKCAAPYLPGVYMRTTFYKPWLRSITGVK